MNFCKKSVLFLAFFIATFSIYAQKSPNGKIAVEKSDNALKVKYKSRSGWQTIYTAEIAGIGKADKRPLLLSYDMKTGKQLHIQKKGNECVYKLNDGGTLFVRAFDDGIAFRKQGTSATGSKSEEPIMIDFSSAKNNWLMKWADSYEDFYPKNREYKSGDRFGYPSLFEYNDGVFALLSESDIHSDNAASCLYATDKKGKFRIQPDENEQEAKGSPWRALIIGSLEDVISSTLITDLSTPCKISNTSWIEPGVASWVYWANNHGSNDYSILKKYIDFAIELRLPYVLIDAEWDEMPKLASNNGKTVEDAVKYAVDNGIKPMIWYNSSVGWINGAPTPKFRLNKVEDREREFAWCEKIGVAGVKIDFFSGDNNMNMKYMIELLESAAKHHLLVNFHGATIPRGWQRTYPNLVSTEAVYGAEWYNNVPTFTKRAAAHNATIPFTRNVIGSMDYTPCAFSDSQHPHITTHAHELALTALYESGIQHLADRPESFLAQPQSVKDYLSALPTAWDETHYVSGYPGESAVLARRKGSSWYIAGINGKDETQALDISALKTLKIKGSKITFFADGADAKDPWNIQTLSNIKELGTSIECKARGGFVIVIEK